MPSFAELLTPTGRERLAAVRRPDVPDFEALETERMTNLAALTLAMDAQDEADAAMRPAKVHTAAPRETVGAIRKPRTKKPEPRLTCTPEEQAAAEAKTGHEALVAALQDNTLALLGQEAEEVPVVTAINVSNLTDAELGRMMRAALLSVRVDQAEAARSTVAAARADQAADRQALLAQEQSERRVDPAFLLPGFNVGDLEIATLDLRDKALGEVVPSKVRSPYNKARFRLGVKEVLDPETTCWRELGVAHKQLAQLAISRPGYTGTKLDEVSAPAVLVAEIDPDAKAKKVAALATVLGISKKAARARMAELSH